jgi:hypothetical protein
MAEELKDTDVLKGGEFLIKETDPQSVFIPEELNEEQRKKKFYPRLMQLISKNPD